MKKTTLLKTLETNNFYRFFINKKVNNEDILNALNNEREQLKNRTLYHIVKIGSNYRYQLTDVKHGDIIYHGQLTNANIEELRDGCYLVNFFYINDNGEQTITSKAIYILQEAL